MVTNHPCFSFCITDINAKTLWNVFRLISAAAPGLGWAMCPTLTAGRGQEKPTVGSSTHLTSHSTLLPLLCFSLTHRGYVYKCVPYIVETAALTLRSITAVQIASSPNCLKQTMLLVYHRFILHSPFHF